VTNTLAMLQTRTGYKLFALALYRYRGKHLALVYLGPWFWSIILP